MEHTPFVQLSRPTELALPSVNTKPTVQWRRIALLLTPLLLALVNLIEAYYEKQRGFSVGTLKYQEFKGRGEAEQAGVIRGAIGRGQSRYETLIAEAENKAKASIEIGLKERATRISQGNYKAVISVSLVNGLVLSMFGRTRDIARLIHEMAEAEIGMAHGRYLKVDRKTGEYSVQEVATNDRSRADLARRLKLMADLFGNSLTELKEAVIAKGASEMVSFAGGTCGDVR